MRFGRQSDNVKRPAAVRTSTLLDASMPKNYATTATDMRALRAPSSPLATKHLSGTSDNFSPNGPYKDVSPKLIHSEQRAHLTHRRGIAEEQKEQVIMSKQPAVVS